METELVFLWGDSGRPDRGCRSVCAGTSCEREEEKCAARHFSWMNESDVAGKEC